MTVPAVLHSAGSTEWSTGAKTRELGRAVLGRYDFDPFSSAEWNVGVGAARILTAQDDAFTCAWFDGAPTAELILAGHRGSSARPFNVEPATGLVNPPGDKSGRNVKRAWILTDWHHGAGWLGGGVLFVLFKIGQLQILQTTSTARRPGAGRSPFHCDFLRCIPKRRLDYDRAPGVPGGAPPHPSALVLMPAIDPLHGDFQRETFRRLAGALGEVF